MNEAFAAQAEEHEGKIHEEVLKACKVKTDEVEKLKEERSRDGEVLQRLSRENYELKKH